VPGSRKSDEEEVENDEVLDGELGEDAEDPVDAVADEEDDGEGLDLDEVPASAAGRASASKLLALFVEKKVLALHVKKPGNPLIEAVARILEGPLPVKQKASKLIDAIVDSDDVDDFFLEDEMLIEILKRW
jgi:hypothetical protein